ncbi:GntR family transcriptional regulator [Desulfospira joergensenii]|uniref:GntR family transcriptional regulator n=1 Tax=Desulfospira joergensenii TaxID=53329 RepID=UPI00048A05FB|nr:GntR family transcriptional regulator [Desulfospira joergensenii]
MSDKKKERDLTHKAYEAIRQMLFYNEIVPGQKIKYNDLAGRIGVSMTPVIQALKWLEFRNIVRHEPNRGYYINEVSRKEITEVYNARLLIEVALVPDIIQNLDRPGLKKLKVAFDRYKTAVAEDKYHKRMITDMEFHMTLASLAGCRIQLNILQGLFDVLLLRYSRNLFYLSVMDVSLPEHSDILVLVENKDEKGLARALSHHISGVRDHIIKGMDRLIIKEKESLADLSFL